MERNVVSLELAKRLKEAGWQKYEATFYWVEFPRSASIIPHWQMDFRRKWTKEAIPAPTAQELADALPARIFLDQVSGGRWRARREWGEIDSNGEITGAFHGKDFKVAPQRIVVTADTMADALASLWLKVQK